MQFLSTMRKSKLASSQPQASPTIISEFITYSIIGSLPHIFVISYWAGKIKKQRFQSRFKKYFAYLHTDITVWPIFHVFCVLLIYKIQFVFIIFSSQYFLFNFKRNTLSYICAYHKLQP